jgi:dTDP-4-amino-4,6-dideoxygalactose transaminase
MDTIMQKEKKDTNTIPMKENDFIVFGRPLIEQEEIDEVVDSLKKAWIGTGPKVAQFENEFAAYKGAKNVAAVGSCTAGLFLAMKALNIGPGDEVITTSMTFVATVNSIVHTGATPVLADIDPLTWNIDPNQIESKITSKTKAIIPVHFAGRPCDMDAIMFLAQKHNLYVIEDCAHAIETEFRGKQAGTFGDFGVFSFYATKNITTGEGGMVISDDRQKVDRIKRLALHGLSRDAWKRFSDEGYQHYFAEEAGFKYNMMDIQAAIGIHQLRKIERLYEKRVEIWNTYLNELVNLPVHLPAPFEKDTKHALHLFQIVLTKEVSKSRDHLLTYLTKHGIGIGVHYLPIATHPFYHKIFQAKDYPHSYYFGMNTISLPNMPQLQTSHINRILQALRSYFD